MCDPPRVFVTFLTTPFSTISSRDLVLAAELGDYLEDEYNDAAYLSKLKLLPQQTRDIEYKIMEHHKEHM